MFAVIGIISDWIRLYIISVALTVIRNLSGLACELPFGEKSFNLDENE